MIYIEKHSNTSTVTKYEEKLREAQLDSSSLSDPGIHPGLKGSAVYDQIKSIRSEFDALKDQMFDEQGGICCYCGRRLQYPNHPQYIVEHVLPKERYRQLAGEYENLLLSCRPSDGEKEAEKEARRRDKKSFEHCDKAKENKEILITPLQSDCADHFEYDEEGEVIGLDSDARSTIEVLNLNCDWLVKRRRAAIAGAIYDENDELLPDDELRQYMSSVMLRNQNHQLPEYCFVIAGAIRHLLK